VRRSSKCATRICKEQLDYWISPITRQNYTTRFKIEIPSLDAKFEVVCTPKEQEFVSRMGSLTEVRTLLFPDVS
jgi:hypothetical protein